MNQIQYSLFIKIMRTQNKNIGTILCFFILITACSNGPSIRSVKNDKVVISVEPKSFVEAYDLAQKECQKTDQNATYIADAAISLKEVVFDCVGNEEVAAATAETESSSDTETAVATENTDTQEN
jgi:hypothetical protein